MESKYVLEVCEYSMTYQSGGSNERDLSIMNAAFRLQKRISTGNTLVLVRVEKIKS